MMEKIYILQLVRVRREAKTTLIIQPSIEAGEKYKEEKLKIIILSLMKENISNQNIKASHNFYHLASEHQNPK